LQRLPIAKFARVRTLPHISHTMTRSGRRNQGSPATESSSAEDEPPPVQETASQESTDDDRTTDSTEGEMFQSILSAFSIELTRALSDKFADHEQVMQSDQYSYHKEVIQTMKTSQDSIVDGLSQLNQTLGQLFGQQQPPPRPSPTQSSTPQEQKTSTNASPSGNTPSSGKHADSNKDSSQPPFVTAKWFLATKSLDSSKFSKALLQVNPVTSDTLSSIRNFYDEVITALSSVTGIPQPLPEYTDLTIDTDFESLLVPPDDHSLHHQSPG